MTSASASPAGGRRRAPPCSRAAASARRHLLPGTPPAVRRRRSRAAAAMRAQPKAPSAGEHGSAGALIALDCPAARTAPAPWAAAARRAGRVREGDLVDERLAEPHVIGRHARRQRRGCGHAGVRGHATAAASKSGVRLTCGSGPARGRMRPSASWLSSPARSSTASSSSLLNSRWRSARAASASGDSCAARADRWCPRGSARPSPDPRAQNMPARGTAASIGSRITTGTRSWRRAATRSRPRSRERESRRAGTPPTSGACCAQEAAARRRGRCRGRSARTRACRATTRSTWRRPFRGGTNFSTRSVKRTRPDAIVVLDRREREHARASSAASSRLRLLRASRSRSTPRRRPAASP